MTAPTKDKEKESWQPGIAGFCGGAISTMLLLPLDNIKVRLQVNEGIHSETISTLSSSVSASASASATSGAKTTTYPPTTTQTQRLGAIRMLQGVIKYEGVRGLYQGLVPAIVGSAVSWGGFFYVYENMKRQLIQFKSTNQATGTTQPLVTLNSWDNFVAGTMSGAVMVFMTNPIWLIKLRLQLQMKRASENLHVNKTVTQYDGFFDAFRKIVRSDGVLGLYKGTGPALLLTTHGGGKILY
jgi:solute carrier family 25 folate transporter 32